MSAFFCLASACAQASPSRFAGDGEDSVLAQPRPQQIGGPDVITIAADSGREVDVKPCDGRFDLGPGLGFERQLTLQHARDTGREQGPFVLFGKCPQFGEGLGIGQAGPVELLRGTVDLEVLLADIDGAESIVVDRMAGRSGVSVALMSSASSW